jgi:ubiquinone/menaquinone biosynthesis C-methylase UbiE
MTEADRIRKEYTDRYAGLGWAALWSSRNLTGIYFRQQIERNLVEALNAARVGLDDAVVLDVGCGSGPHLRYFAELGAERDRLHGIDLVPERIEIARKLTPGVNLRVADAVDLPYDTGAFDVVSQFTALCNIHDPIVLKKAAGEMTRVLKSGGVIVWVDIMREGEGAPYRAVPETRVRELFPGFRMVARRRIFHRWSYMLGGRLPEVALALERMPLPKSHLVAVLQREP